MTNSLPPVDPIRLDENMRLTDPEKGTDRWLSPLDRPFRLSGFAWFERDRVYRRLPLSPSVPIPDAVDSLANCTAGGELRFQTDSSRLVIKAKLAGPPNMYHMPATGQCGFDCYLGDFGDQKYLGTTRMGHTATEIEHTLFDFSAFPRRMRSVTIYFPLYQGVKDVQLGFENGASVLEPKPDRRGKRIVLYGTSITQGGCAARTGMAYPNIMSRRIPYEFINLGFSGNGKGEPELARLISEIEDPAMLILDYVANAGEPAVYAQTLPAFIHIYREKHPGVPILVVSRIPYAMDRFLPQQLERRRQYREISRATVEACASQGDRNIFFLDGDLMLGDDFEECTVDGVHPTDLGFLRMADAMTPVVKDILGG